MNAHFAFTRFSGKRVHLGVCGSISAYKAPDILRGIRALGASCSVTLTPAATRFISPLTFQALQAAPVYTAMFDDTAAPSPFAHLEPGQTADAMLIAPASAATMSRLASGMADDLLACQALAFSGPLLIAPAMNPRMWNHPATQQNMTVLQQRGVAFVQPGWGHTACGEYGQGRLAELDLIHLHLLKALSPQDMQGKKVMLTLGPTREGLDALRYVSNPSTGIMGAALAVAAWLRGADVTAVCGPGCPWLPAGIQRIETTSAFEMYEAAKTQWPLADIGLFTAAVADFRPRSLGDAKFKKSSAPDGFDLHFEPNPDIFASLSAAPLPHQKVVGFAAESHNFEEAARNKRRNKNTHLLVGNLLADSFGKASNTVFITDVNGREEHWSNVPKADVAWDILTWLLAL